ncbi:hypothetical protein T01_16223 [Trichinella spiralis]|uniref:Uncharacterized protein n=1 Tax=Trichinella spiralis TaxID=6334 RepID=A0A0V1AQG6_TRISP|nr:hypothetical protein T01_16223 [Trichinella spiralis]
MTSSRYTKQSESTRHLQDPLKGGRLVAQFKGHHFDLVQAQKGYEGRLLLIMFFHLNLPVAAFQVWSQESLHPANASKVSSILGSGWASFRVTPFNCL